MRFEDVREAAEGLDVNVAKSQSSRGHTSAGSTSQGSAELNEFY